MTITEGPLAQRISSLRQLCEQTLEHPEVLRSDLRSDAMAVARLGIPEAEAELEDRLNELTRCYFLSGEQRLLVRLGLPFLTYNPAFALSANAAEPWMPTLPERPVVPGNTYKLFGKQIGFPFGVPASVLTINAKYVAFYAANGFNVITYKTVRTRLKSPHKEPLWLFLRDCEQPFPVGMMPKEVEVQERAWPTDRRAFSTVNSFGMPSEEPKVWQDDVRLALGMIADDQLMILSVVGTLDKGDTDDDFIADYALAAKLASETRVKVIELNLSCPNSIDPVTNQVSRELVCQSKKLSRSIVEACRQSVGDEVKLIAKLSWMSEADLREVIAPLLAEGLLDGISGINTIQADVVDKEGRSPFPGRDVAGVSGAAIREHAVDFVRSLARIRGEMEHFDIVASGGVLRPEHVQILRDAGADAVQSATGALTNPELAAEVAASVIEGPAPFSTVQLPTGVGLARSDLLVRVLANANELPIQRVKILTYLGDDEFERTLHESLATGLVLAKRMKGEPYLRLSATGRRVLETEQAQ
jgi:dihydroorotate dehydrogenase